MNWNDLKIFIAIAEAGTLAGAARTLAQNHSTVFRRLNALESDVRTRLFERLATGYTLTPAGERMLELARQADDAVTTIDRELVGRDLDPTGTVRLTTAPDLARLVVPRAIKALRRSHPGILVEVSAGDSDYDLNRREADLALRATTRPPEHLVGRKVMSLSWWIAGRSRSASRTWRALADADFIGAERALMRLDAFQWLEKHYGHRVVARANDLSTMAGLARAGVGLALLPSDVQEPGLKRLHRVPDLAGELWLLTHPDLRHVQRIRTVWDALIDALGDEDDPDVNPP
ncbi:MAG: LysR family transcriptional regulator [Pseudomonadales bacterium]